MEEEKRRGGKRMEASTSLKSYSHEQQQPEKQEENLNGTGAGHFPVRNADEGSLLNAYSSGKNRREYSPVQDGDKDMSGRNSSASKSMGSATIPEIATAMATLSSCTHSNGAPVNGHGCDDNNGTDAATTVEGLNEVRLSCSNIFSIAGYYGQADRGRPIETVKEETSSGDDGSSISNNNCGSEQIGGGKPSYASSGGGGGATMQESMTTMTTEAKENAAKTSFIAGYMGSWKRNRYLSGNFTVSGDTMEGIVQCLVFLKAFSVR